MVTCNLDAVAGRMQGTPCKSGRSRKSMKGSVMSDTKGNGIHAAKRANATAARKRKANPGQSSKAQSVLGKKGAKARS